MPRWTRDDVPGQAGQVALVTGASSGLGLQVAAGLASAGARVLAAVRSRQRGEAAVARIRSEVPGARVELVDLDLADLSSVRAAAEEVAQRSARLDLLVNNAGVMALPYSTTADGFENQLGTNHLGHFALTGLLLPSLLAERETATPARVVTVSSTAHRMGKIDFEDLQSERSYRPWRAYGQSKLANLLFAQELHRRAEQAHLPLICVAAHPGYAATNLQLAGPRERGSRVGAAGARVANRLFGQSDAQGALPILYAATMPDVLSGEYFGPDGPFEARGYPTRVGMTDAARDEDTARRLWAVSQDLTGVRYDALPAPASPSSRPGNPKPDKPGRDHPGTENAVPGEEAHP